MGQVAGLGSQGAWLGFRLDTDAPTPTITYDEDAGSLSGTHWQSLARFEHGGLPWMVAGLDGAAATDEDDEPDPAQLLFVELASRTDREGERLRSNRLAGDLTTEETAPPSDDISQDVLDLPSYYRLPGGMQCAGPILCVAATNPASDDEPDFPTGHHGSTGAVLFVDLSDPTSPSLLEYELGVEMEDAVDEDDEDTTEARSRIGTVGITQIGDGRFLLLAMSIEGRHLHAWLSQADNIDGLVEDLEAGGTGTDAPFVHFDSWYFGEAGSGRRVEAPGDDDRRHVGRLPGCVALHAERGRSRLPVGHAQRQRAGTLRRGQHRRAPPLRDRPRPGRRRALRAQPVGG